MQMDAHKQTVEELLMRLDVADKCSKCIKNT